MFYIAEDLFGRWEGADYKLLYAFMLLAAIVALRLVRRSGVEHKFEVFCLVLYILTGELNQAFIIALPGLDFFHIQPIRMLFFIFAFFLFRKIVIQKDRSLFARGENTPMFMVALYVFIGYYILSQAFNVSQVGVSDVLLSIFTGLKILVLIFTLKLLSNRETVMVIGRAFIIAGVFTSVLSLIQIAVDPEFMRIGDYREAFGNLLRANGMFSTEYHNSYFIIASIAWLWATEKNRTRMFLLFALFAAAVFFTFHRMSWLVLAFVTFVYFVWIDHISTAKLALIGLAGMAALLATFILFQSEIMNSSLVKERITATAGGRAGYYHMVFENIGKKPLFGYGNQENEVYYYYMLRITWERERATGETGGIHNGYLSVMFYYGVPAFLFFVLFIFLTVAYFGRLSYLHLFFAIPFLYSVLYMFGNLTNDLIFEKYPAQILAILLGVGLGLRRRPEELGLPDDIVLV